MAFLMGFQGVSRFEKIWDKGAAGRISWFWFCGGEGHWVWRSVAGWLAGMLSVGMNSGSSLKVGGGGGCGSALDLDAIEFTNFANSNLTIVASSRKLLSLVWKREADHHNHFFCFIRVSFFWVLIWSNKSIVHTHLS